MLNRYTTFSDESHIGNHRYMIIGGLVCRPEEAKSLRARIRRAQGRFPDGLKWERIRRRNFGRYASLIEDFAILNRDQRVDFAAIVIDMDLADHKRFNEGDSEMGFHKFLAQHLLRHSRELGRQATFHCYYAYRTSPRHLYEVQDAINNMARIHYRDDKRRFLELKNRQFSAEPMFFLADILIGAVGAAYNVTLKPGAKRDLAELIRCEAGLETLAKLTLRERRNFNIWEFRMRT